jgi:hypothetical protein
MPEQEQRRQRQGKGPNKRITVEYPAEFFKDNADTEEYIRTMDPAGEQKREPTVLVKVGRPAAILVPIIALLIGTFLIWLLYIVLM